MPTHRTRIPTPQPYELLLGLTGHGWYALAPHRLDREQLRFETALRLGRAVVDAALTERRDGLQLELTAKRALTRGELGDARRQVAHMLRLDDDLDAFHAQCAQVPRLRWVADRGGGRLLRSATVFEDLMKLLFTTNTSWAATEAMTRNLVDALGTRAPSGTRAFPTPEQCLQDEGFYRDVVRCGYRAQAAIELAEGFVGGALHDELFLAEPSSDALWQRLCGLRGFGPYAAGQAMRLCGHYQQLAIDSWCRARLAQLDGAAKPPKDAAVARRYASFAPYQGLAMWCDLTAEWHVE